MSRFCALMLLVVWIGPALTSAAAESWSGDLLVYGATPGGIAAALAAADEGDTVLLVEPTSRIGGLVTNGLSHTDFRTFEGLSGTFLEFTRLVEAAYVRTYGASSQQVRDSFRGTFGEPHVNLAVFEEMLAARPSLRLETGSRLDVVTPRELTTGRSIASVTFVGPDARSWTARAAMFIDGTYEGDLMAAAGVPWRAGRESRSEYGESLAPELADDQLQAYNFRLVMTRDPDNRVSVKPPDGYRREDCLPLLEILESGQIQSVFGYPSGCLFKAQLPPLPNGKYDINDVSRASVRLSLPGTNLGWPDGDAERRGQIFAEHLRDQLGILYFVQHDEAVPEAFRHEARAWGLCRDEFTRSGHLPTQLYVREARRMVGQYIFTENDSNHAAGDARAVLHTDAIATGDYGNNCHGTAHQGPRFGGRHTGEFYRPVPPYQIPYGVLVPRSVVNLLVPVATSSSHVGFCALRLEPIWTSLGQAAGHAAHLARVGGLPVQQVPVAELQLRLQRAGAATIYVSDVPPGHPDFQLVQWWGTAGGWHGLAPAPAQSGPRGPNITGQYYRAFPNHAAGLDVPMTEEVAQRWRDVAVSLGLSVEVLPTWDSRRTRGDWLREVGRLAASKTR
jgi:hypothetical protein